MFSMDIVDTDAFLDMPASSQALYFHLAMRADDDGFVGNPRKVMKICGSGEDDYKILVGKRFVIQFDRGICVIKHWKIHNYLRKDTHKETKYTDEKSMLVEKVNGAYTEAVDGPSRNVERPVAQIREGKVREEKKRQEYGDLKNVLLSDDEYQKLIQRYGRSAITQLISQLSTYMASTGKTYKDYYATVLNWAARKGTVEVVQRPEAVEEKLTPEQVAANQKRIDGVRGALASKFKMA